MKSSFPVDSSHKAHIHDQILNSSANNAKIKEGEIRERKEIIFYVNWKYKMFQAKMNYIMRVFFSMSKRFLMGQKKEDGKSFLLTNIIRLANIPPISIVFPHNALVCFLVIILYCSLCPDD